MSAVSSDDPHLVPLPASFFARECLTVALSLLGKLLVRGEVVLRISEVEAYRHPGDTANHCRAGRTARNAPMWGPPGYAYIYLCYGVHALLNLVTDREGEGAAVLIRAAEPLAGHASITARRGGKLGPASLAGPGKVAQALGLDVSHSGLALTQRSGLYVADAPDVATFRVGPRVGVDYAAEVHRLAPWRLALVDSRCVSMPKGLAVWQSTPQSYLRAQALVGASEPSRVGVAEPTVPAALSARRTRSSRP
jgi:DNA-3-methyladenine glycosylase